MSLIDFRDSKDLKNTIIYSYDEVGVKKEVMNKARMIRGVEYGLKRMSPNTEATLLLPSALAYGNTGDNNKISGDQPLIIELKLFQIHNEK